jgi:hypothetical protein
MGQGSGGQLSEQCCLVIAEVLGNSLPVLREAPQVLQGRKAALLSAGQVQHTHVSLGSTRAMSTWASQAGSGEESGCRQGL